MTTARRRVALLVTALAVPLGALVLGVTPTAQAATALDLYQPVVVGSPYANDDVGEVDVFNPDGTTEQLT